MAPIYFYRKAVVVGAGYIAVEMAGILNALGSDVTLVIRKDNKRTCDVSLPQSLLQKIN